MDTIDQLALYEKLDGYISRHYDYGDEEVLCDAMVLEESCHSVAQSEQSSAIGGVAGFFNRFAKHGRKRIVPQREAPSMLPSDFSASVIDRLEDSFGTLLIKAINKRGLNNADVYKDANIDRRLFSKIISNEGYSPTKGTVLALAIALKLNLDETTSFLKSAGYALSHSSKSDLVVEYFIGETNGNYNIDIVNDALEHFGQPPLGSRL
ncbi:MAG: helix-turn-helix transcriptional regulator [Bacteroidales bacterium]|nr:helix-turn-helix transcriptional regulator [Bacteroidales bacterium]